jgi:hypothetical protein
MGVNKDELMSLIKRDVLAFGISMIDLQDGKQWQLNDRRWVIDMYNEVNPWVIEKYPAGVPRRMSVLKSTQSGISTLSITKSLHFLSNWPGRVGYGLPRDLDVLDFSLTRLDPVIAASEYLSSKLGVPNSAHTKRIGDGYFHFFFMTNEPRMIPIDFLVIDELDLCEPNNVVTALNRMDASRWKMTIFLSTPTIANYGIHAVYGSSDMRKWNVRCHKCNEWQVLDWEKNVRVKGARNNPTDVTYVCSKCGTEITPAMIQEGQWVAEVPSKSSEHVGFHVSQMMSYDAMTLYKHFIDPQSTLIEFYRKRLGVPYEMGGGSLERDDILASCFDLNYEFEPVWDGRSTYYLGVDQGNELQALVAKVEPNSRRIQIVHVELIPMEKGFDRLAQLMEIYHVHKGIGDANPNRHSMMDLVKKYPGRFLAAEYIESQREVWKAKKGDGKNYNTNVTLNRTSGFDGLMDTIKKGQWALPGHPPNLHPDVELIIDHITAIKRDIETRRSQSGEVQVAVWRKLRAEHLAHSWLYLKTAIELDKGRGMKIAVIGKSEEETEKTDAEDTYKPVAEIVISLTAILAEVPKDQLREYLSKEPGDEKYEIPFPLSYKLTRAEGYSQEDIVWVMNALLDQTKILTIR